MKTWIWLIFAAIGFTACADRRSFGNQTAELTAPGHTRYDEAQSQFYRKQYAQARELFQQFLREPRQDTGENARIVRAIDQIGRIYLREEHRPDSAVAFFTWAQDSLPLTESEQDVVSEWIAAAQDWLSVGVEQPPLKNPDSLYALGKRYYRAGSARLSFPLDNAGNADFAIAQTYLLPFIVNYDEDTRSGEALYMMGDIRRHLLNDLTFWSENFYFKEVIRRYPNTDLARRAYRALEEEVRFSYSGTSGEQTPPSVVGMLELYRRMAFGGTPQKAK